MKRVLVAGATGYLGHFLVKQLRAQGFWVCALARRQSPNLPSSKEVDELFLGDVTQADSLVGCCQNVDFVISALGLTRPTRHLTYTQVDYQGNLNLLAEAQQARIDRFVYIHIFGAQQLLECPPVRAKQAFVDRLKASGLAYQLICPTGFFSDMANFQEYATRGRLILFDHGNHRINPIHGKDLAEYCVAHLDHPATDLAVGGPDTFRYNDIATLAFASLNKPERITHWSPWFARLLIRCLVALTPIHVSSPLQFLSKVMTRDLIAPAYGRRTLEAFFSERVNDRGATHPIDCTSRATP